MTTQNNIPAGSTICMKSETSNWSADDFATLVRWIDDKKAFVTIHGQDGGDEYVAFANEFELFVPENK